MSLTRVGTEFFMGATGAFKQNLFPTLATLNNGDVVVGFGEVQSFGPDSDIDGAVFLNILDDTGASSGLAQRVNTDTSDGQAGLSLTALTGGGFVATWASDERDFVSGNYDLDAILRVYDASGTPVTPEIDLSPADVAVSGVADDEFIGAVFAKANGGFTVA